MSRAPALLISAGEAVDRRLLHARLPGLLLTAGALGDRFGRKRALTFGLVVFALGSALSAVAGSAGMLIASRALMGVGGAFIMPSTLSILTATFPPAGVGKATLYRRYDSKQDLVAHAIRHLNREIPVPDTGSVAGDILAVAGAVIAAAVRMGAVTLMPRLLAESAGDAEMHGIFYENLVAPRRAVMAEVLRRGVERGELRRDLDVELAIDLLTGPWVYRLLIAGGDPAVVERVDPGRLLDLVLTGIASRAAGSSP